MTGGRPLRFLLMVVGGWTGARAWWLWPAVPTLPALARTVMPEDLLASLPLMRPDVPPLSFRPLPISRPASRHAISWPRPARALAAARATASRPAIDPRGVELAQASMLRYGDPVPGPDPIPSPTRPRSRLSGSAWLLARGGPALAGGLAGAQLGGSQAGVRLAYAVDHARRLSIVGRLSTAIGAAGAGSGREHFLSDREGAIGLAWRPTRLPITLVAEQRFVFDGGNGGPTLGVIAGLPPTRIAAGFRLEAYGQAGAIARGGTGGTIEGFGDGAARLTRPTSVGGVKLDVGAGAWGGAQRGGARLDVGPSIGASLPLAGHTVRLTADWRERIAGTARPGSGPALSLGTDF